MTNLDWNVSKQTMSNRNSREEARANASKNLSVANKCVAIVLCQNDGDDTDQTVVDPTDGNIIQSSEVQKALWPNGFNGKELLQDFKIRNKTCYWNPSLVESIRSLEYKGFFEPSTILVSAADIHLENLRSAWGRRVLKAPGGFSIERIGKCFWILKLNANSASIEKGALYYKAKAPLQRHCLSSFSLGF